MEAHAVRLGNSRYDRSGKQKASEDREQEQYIKISRQKEEEMIYLEPDDKDELVEETDEQVDEDGQNIDENEALTDEEEEQPEPLTENEALTDEEEEQPDSEEDLVEEEENEQQDEEQQSEEEPTEEELVEEEEDEEQQSEEEPTEEEKVSKVHFGEEGREVEKRNDEDGYGKQHKEVPVKEAEVEEASQSEMGRGPEDKRFAHEEDIAVTTIVYEVREEEIEEEVEEEIEDVVEELEVEEEELSENSEELEENKYKKDGVIVEQLDLQKKERVDDFTEDKETMVGHLVKDETEKTDGELIEEEEEFVEELIEEDEEIEEEEAQEKVTEIVPDVSNIRVKEKCVLSEKQSEKSTGESRSHYLSGSESMELGYVPSSSDEKKRTAEVSLTSSGKKQKNETFSAADLSAGSPSSCMQCETGNSVECRTSGSSGRKRQSRWDMQLEEDQKVADDDAEGTKRKKTRWEYGENEGKIIGPLQLPDFIKGQHGGAGENPIIKKLNEELLEINKQLLDPKTCDESRTMLSSKKQKIISKLIKKIQAFKSPPTNNPSILYKKLYIPLREFPDFNFCGLILGPGGKNQKKMEKETGAKILLRGKGSVKCSDGEKKNTKPDPSDEEDLHVRIEANNETSLDAAVSMVEKLLVPVTGNKLKLEQLAEIAMLKGAQLKCNICLQDGHLTQHCPLTSRSPTSDVQPSNSDVQIADGFFSSFSSKVNPSSNSGIKVEAGNNGPRGYKVDESRLYVGYLPPDVNIAKLVQLFNSFGTIVNARVARDPATGLPKGYGFVKYDNATSAANAIRQMHGFRLGHNTLAVRVAGPSQPHSTTGNTNAMIPPVGQPLVQLGTPVIPQGFPHWPNAPSMIRPGYWMACPQPQVGGIFPASSVAFNPHAPPYGCGVYPTPVLLPLPLTGNAAKMELDTFAGNPEKSSTSLFSSISTQKTSVLESGNHRASTYPGPFATSRLSPPVHINNVKTKETGSFPGNPDYSGRLYHL